MEVLKSATLILASLFVGTFATSSDIQEFLVDNGHLYVDVFYNSSNWREIILRDLYIARLPFEDISKAHNNSFGIFMFDVSKDDIMSYLLAITQRKIKMSLLVLSEPWNKQKINSIKNHLRHLRETAFFYIAIPTTNSTCLTWQQLISLKSGSALNHLKFANKSSKIIEKFDMQGLEITSSSLTWAPYITFEDCNKDGLDCAKKYGYLIDLLDKLAVEFNFTHVSQKNEDNVFYHVGPDGNYGGVWGDVESNQRDMSLSSWLWLSSRHDIFGFVPFLQRKFVLAFTPQQSGIVDYGFFTRAFVQNTWTTVLCTLGAILLLLLLGNKYGTNDNTKGIKILTFTLWLYFTLINCYYCGVLTMFFTTSNELPFNTMNDVLLAYPDWNLRFQGALKGWIYNMAESGDTNYALLWQRYKENSTDTTFDSIQNGLELMESGQNVLLVDENKLLGHIKSHPTQQKIVTISLRKSGESACILFSKNTPLLPMFNQGVSHIRESGLQGQLFYKWFEKLEKQSGSASFQKHVLTLSEMVTVFVMMLAVFVVALIVLCGELTMKTFFNRPHDNGYRGYVK